MARKDNTLLYVGLAAGAGVGLYMYLKGEYYTQVNTMMGFPSPSQPGLLELIFSSASNTFAQARYLDDSMKMRGDVHYKAWKKAVESSQIFYAVSGVCFVTKTGMPCPE